VTIRHRVIVSVSNVILKSIKKLIKMILYVKELITFSSDLDVQ